MCKFDISIDGEVGENYFQFPLQNKACTSMYVRNLQHFKLEKKNGWNVCGLVGVAENHEQQFFVK